jgi:hypothetical protein
VGHAVSDISTLSVTDGWFVFPTEIEAQQYADRCWAQFLYVIPTERLPEAVRDRQPRIDAHQMTLIEIAAVVDIPILSLDHLGNIVEHAPSRAWAIPRRTATGEWAVPCPTGFDAGGPEPVWPDPAPVLVALVPDTSVVGQPVTVTVTCDPVAGAPFTSSSVIHADGAPLPTVFVDASTLTVSGTPIVDGTAEVTVANGLFVSNALTFTVTLT